MSWTLLIISEKSTLLKKMHLPAFSYHLTFSTFHLIKVGTDRGGVKGGLWMWNITNSPFVGKSSNPSWTGRKETKTFGAGCSKLG
jgi:hypothetical protein